MSCSDEEHNMDYIDEMPSDSHSHDCKEKFSFQGRHLTTMSQDSPFKLTKNQLQTWSMHTDSRSFIFLQLQTLSGREDISTLLLVVCPTGKAVRHRIHIFCTGSQNHLGSAQVTPEEVDLLERHHRPDNYSLVYCSLSITLQDMVGNGVIKREIFDVVRNQSQVSWHSEYQGKPLCISYKSSTSDVQLPIRNTLPEGIGDVQEQSNEEQKVSKVDPSSTQTFAQKWLFLESQKKAEIQSKRMLMEGNKSASEVTRLSEGSKSHQPNLPAIAGTEDAQSALKAETEKNLKEVEDRQASSLTQLKTTESQKSTAEDSSLKQKRRHHSVPASNQVATRLPHIRKFALRQSKSEELRQKREEERKADEAQRNPNAKSKSSKEEQEEQKRKQQKLNQPSLHFSQTRSFLLRRQVTEAAIKRRDEALRKEQKRILPSLLESQRRLPSIRYSALRPSKTELKKKRREDRRKQQQSLQRQRRAAEARWICEEEERARREQEERKGR
ncbi:trichohyalin-like [Drosophila guanche]|uniref:trichohyalin-like n=1 Tax=Drosophila guanche TaxID=7266 RepID=UPI001471BB98|nr:trichohyalin-like [Drosophila guanche]